jgi:DNA-binding MarR family transcriptional regulator
MKKELKLDNQLCFRLYVASRNMTRLYHPLLEQYNLTYPQYIVLLVLFEKEVIDFKELSTIVDLKTGTLTPIVNKIEETGYLIKQKNPDDARKVNILLTIKGKDLRESIISVPLQLGETLNVSISSYTSLVTELDDLIRKMKEV